MCGGVAEYGQYLWVYGVSEAPYEDEGAGVKEARRELYPLIERVAFTT